MSWFKKNQKDQAAQAEQSVSLAKSELALSTAMPEVEPVTTSEPAATGTSATEVVEDASPVAEGSESSLNSETAREPQGRFAKLKSKLVRKQSDSTTPVAGVNGTVNTSAEDAKFDKLTQITARSSTRAEKPKYLAVPVRVVIGYLPEVTERDALEYAVGLAEKHFEQIGMSYFDAVKYGNGYAFEAHEGGSGKAYLPEIIRYFDAQGAFNPGEDVKAIIRTATRAVEVQRTREGLAAIILPERDETPPSDWLQPTTSMQPAINKRTGFLVVGAALFTTGFIAMIVTSMLTRFQEYEPAPEPVVQRIDASQLPNQQWARLSAIPENNFVRALRYRNGRWEAPEVVAATPGPTSAVLPPPTPAEPGMVTPPPPAVGSNSPSLSNQQGATP